MTVEPNEARQETSITTAFQSCDDTDTSSEPLGFFAFLRLVYRVSVLYKEQEMAHQGHHCWPLRWYSYTRELTTTNHLEWLDAILMKILGKGNSIPPGMDSCWQQVIASQMFSGLDLQGRVASITR